MFRRLHFSLLQFRFFATLLAISAAVMVSATPAQAATITVNSTVEVVNPGPGGDGDLKCSLSEAIRAANTDLAVDGCAAGAGADTIILPRGIYTLTQAEPGRSFALPLVTSDITIQGDPSLPTIITRGGANNFSFLEVNGTGITLTLRGFTMRAGSSSSNNDPGAILFGGGANVTVDKVGFFNNSGGIGGVIGGSGGGTVTITNCAFDNNFASQFGGVLATTDSATSYHINDAAFTNNSAASFGGAISAGGVSTITDSVFRANLADASSGGAILLNSGTLTISTSEFTGNANRGGGSGGAIVALSTLNIDQSTFTSNTSTGGGGAIRAVADLSVNNSTFANNNSSSFGGAINTGGATNGTFTNVTISGNSSQVAGGGISLSGPSNTLNNVTITGNSSQTTGGGVTGTFITIANSIIAGNTDVSGSPDAFFGASVTSHGHNLIGDGSGSNFVSAAGDQVGTGTTPIDPLLGILADNGGTTLTHGLRAGSPALDAGDPGTPGNGGNTCELRDQIGTARPVGTACDIGAFEGTVTSPGQFEFSSTAYGEHENKLSGLATIVVNRTHGTDGAVTVDFATSDGTATEGADYTATSATLSFADGEASKIVTIPLINDTVHENTETVDLSLINETGGAILGRPASAVLNIVDDDPLPTLSIDNVSIPEGNSGTSDAIFTVTLSAPSSQTVTINYTTANATATAGSDYVASSDTLTFSPGQTTQNITVVVNGDTAVEPDETFVVNLLNPVNATIPVAQGAGTITNDDIAGATATTTGIIPESNPSVVGSTNRFSAVVTVNPPGTGVPTGTVTFLDNGVAIAGGTALPLDAAGRAVLQTNVLSVGSHSITAVYSGDANFATSTSLVLIQTVNQATTATTTLASTANPSTYGDSVTLSATVTPSTATGTVQFLDGGVNLGNPRVLVGGVATGSTTALSAGPHSITGVYSGDANFAASTSTVLVQGVNKAGLTVTANNFSRTFGAANPTFTGIITGIQNGDAITATFTTTATATSPVGPHLIVPTPAGAALVNYFVILGNATLQIVPATSSTALASSAPSSLSGASVTFTATVTSTGGTPTGNVTFQEGATTLGTGALNASGVATFSTATLSVGAHSITAVYSGDTNFVSSTSAALTQVVNSITPPTGADFSFTANTTSFTLRAGQSANFPLTITPTAGFNSAVSFSCLGLPVLSSCEFSPATVTPNGASVSTTVTVKTTGSASGTVAALRLPGATGTSQPQLAFWAGLGTMGLVGVFIVGDDRRFSKRSIRKIKLSVGLVLTMLLLLIAGCGGHSQTPQGVSSVVVTATGGSVTHTTAVTVTVAP